MGDKEKLELGCFSIIAVLALFIAWQLIPRLNAMLDFLGQYRMIFLWLLFLALGGAIFRFLLIPAFVHGTPILMSLVDAYIRISDHLHKRQQLGADERGNYPIYLPDPRQPTPHPMIFAPGNPAYAPQYVRGEVVRIQEEQQYPPSIEAAPEQQNIPGPKTIPTTAQLIEAGVIGPGQKQISFGYVIDTEDKLTPIEAFHGSWTLLYTVFIAGGSRSGKSNLMASWLLQSIACGACIYLIDKHARNDNSLTARLSPLGDWIIASSAGDAPSLRKCLTHAQTELQARMEGRSKKCYPCMFVVDEAFGILAQCQMKGHDEVYDELGQFMMTVATEGAKFGYFGVYAVQLAQNEQLGSFPIKDACTATVALRMKANQARMIVFADYRDLVQRMRQGQALITFADGGEPVYIGTHLTEQEDAQQLAALLPLSPLKKAPETTRKSPVSDRFSASFSRETPTELSIVPLPVSEEETSTETAWQATVNTVRELKAAGFNQGQILLKVWGVKAGASQAYKDALSEYRAIEAALMQEAKEA